MKLTINGTPIEEFTVVSGENTLAAEELTSYLEKATGVRLPIEYDSVKERHEIRLGAPANTCRRLKLEGITNDGYVIKEALGNLLIRSNTETGVLNGVYEFLHRIVGWRFLNPGVELLRDENAVVDVPEGYTYSHNPAYEYRQLDWRCTYDDAWKRKNHVNFKDFNWVYFVHTLAALAETNKPESQPCLSDESVFETVVKNVRKILDENPDCKIISVSQNDNFNYCRCEKCAAVDEEEGSHAGTLLRFVNRVADAIKDDYPDVSIDTLAYQYTRKAPLITKPRDNVIIRLCSIECCFKHELNDPDCEVNAAFKRDIIEWGKISKRLYIWDYVTDFSYYVPPFPNWNVLLGNLKFFADNHAAGMYPEGNHNSISGEFGELRAYLLARAMWDPYMTAEEFESLQLDFLRGYYGAGWEYVKKFIDFTLKESEKCHMSIWQHPFDIIPREVYAGRKGEIDSWWDKAEALAKDGAELDRIRKSRLQWTAVKLLLEPNEDDGRKFYDDTRRYGVKWNEWRDFGSAPDFSLAPTEWVV
ncbi:MAG: DUF4838 domain-containing protein [Eubacteriales bacterium]